MSRRTDNGRRFRLLALIGTLVFALVATLPLSAQGSTLLSDDFQDGNATGWTTSGGSWSVVSDGTLAYRQSSTSGNARALAGSTGWTDQSVQARIKPIAFAGGSEFVAVLARVQNSSNFYYATLRNANKIEIKKTVSGSAKVLATADFTVNTGTWYTLRLEAQGTTLRAFVNGTQYLSVSDSQFASGQAGLATYNGSASFDDVLVTGAGSPVTPTPITPTAVTTTPVTSTPTTPTATQPPCPTPGLVGFATVNALGQNGTTGGAGGPVVTVSTATELLDYIARSGPYVIQVQGTIALPGPMHNVASDKTIIGLGSNAGITGGGFNIGLPLDNALTSPPANAVKNIIIRNLRFSGYADDAINVQMFSHHVWIDHNRWGTGSDGGVDIKRGSSYVTVSWNHANGT
ncbi:MAG TPA: family 16 glycoside hydrolase, partial [Roseiflexaceae bacterium]|nr:family 16 glycoside hydrolase [Roseiflexaceae bacterium]